MKARILLNVSANARKTEFAGRVGEAWKLRIAAPPVDDKANQAIMDFIARVAGVRASAVRIVRGTRAARKLIEVDGIESETLHRVILESHGSRPDTGSAAAREA